MHTLVGQILHALLPPPPPPPPPPQRLSSTVASFCWILRAYTGAFKTQVLSGTIKNYRNPVHRQFYNALIKCDLNPSDELCFTEHWSSVIWTLLMHSILQSTDQVWFGPFWCTPFHSALIKCDLNPADTHFVSQRTDQVWFEPCWYPLCFTVHWPSVIWTMPICTVLQCSALLSVIWTLLICTLFYSALVNMI